MQSSKLAPFEVLHLTKILNSEITTYKKIDSVSKMTTDEDLKAFFNKMKDEQKNNIKSIQNFIGDE
ncbi:hypothetical protein BJV85_001114 [Clostridium acetobutylicum]|uniref:Uncharacterized protein n=1 Tax=Clostridium acetobutylicum (strain ATCC 824 / DSM 792 / JCM 1419 / IAM 19013 / LMG 5710 / NBRC 13948 / NRRL B-527 / VKM B-1787 / 2291 / W) TaxID=272562 RepID=Q97FG1_CLOAB|nr:MULTISPECIES: hypothetical protein [Clostridium]AAK80723.1 Hypothetical protein CA_C2779 [Clostridium acetobutylicum ATCC 824]ADZ21824.1 Conserved hypothetical protein [Clostridium acetobutylicum EA 2018]AEI32543.1 hypothetical protein SMB_G2815 [Clostridium acetobutylicum DSM 1731]AWV78863.1 hypothetical protein DK921_01800 [Clostridium acetobutylicum]KHD37089.1 hypothetical protein NL50_07100 [Clostridium acetobutylicum]